MRLSSGKLAYAGATDTDCAGTLTRDVLAVGEYVTVDLANAESTQIMGAHAAFVRNVRKPQRRLDRWP